MLIESFTTAVRRRIQYGTFISESVNAIPFAPQQNGVLAMTYTVGNSQLKVNK